MRLPGWKQNIGTGQYEKAMSLKTISQFPIQGLKRRRTFYIVYIEEHLPYKINQEVGEI